MARILIADDSMPIRYTYEDLLEYLGHDIISCKDGEEALTKFAAEHVDLMILDVQMPKKTGIEVCRAVRQQPRGVNIPIIIASSLQEEDEILEGLNAGANDYLIKPVKESHLIARLKNLLNTCMLHSTDYELAKNHVIIAERYKIQRIIGSGRHSIVFEVHDIKENKSRKVLKLLNDNIKDPLVIADYLKTAEKISEIDSKYIVKTLETGQYAGRCYLILEYVSNGDLRELLKYRKLSFKEAVHIGRDISKAILELKKKRIIHFDIKPENILISEAGHFKLADFGMLTTRDTATIPMNTEIWSTAAYVSPEYINAEYDLSPQCDIYSLGVTLYEGIAGDNPFASDKPLNSLFRQINIQAPDLDSLNEDIPLELSNIIRVMTAKNPNLRPKPAECIKMFLALSDPAKYPWLEMKRKKSDVNYRMNNDFGGKEAVNLAAEDAEKSINKLEELALKTHAVAQIKPVGTTTPPVYTAQKTNMVKPVVMGAACLLIAILLGNLMSFMFSSSPESSKGIQKGPETFLECSECGKREKKRCKDISNEKCSECSAPMSMAMECSKCGNTFPGIKKHYDKTSGSFKCPYCNSKDTKLSSKLKTKK